MGIQGEETITIVRRSSTGSVDDFGNPTWSTDEVTVSNVLVAFGSTGEPLDVSREPVDARLTLYLPHGTQILDGDIFTVRNSDWEKDGDSIDWPIVGGFVPSVVVNVRRRRG